MLYENIHKKRGEFWAYFKYDNYLRVDNWFECRNSLKGVVIAGILTIAIVDAFSDGLGIHISEESEKVF